MRRKRLLVAALVVGIILTSVVIALRQSGADQQLIVNLLPKFERRLGVRIQFKDASASLRGVILTAVQVNSPQGDLFATIEHLDVGVRLIPLLFGEVDIDAVQISGLRMFVGKAAGGADPRTWGNLAARLRSSSVLPSTSGTTRSTPEISIESGSVLFSDDRFEGSVEGITARITSSTGSIFEAKKIALNRQQETIAAGTHLEMLVQPHATEVSVRLRGPSLFLPMKVSSLKELFDDATNTTASLRTAFPPIGPKVVPGTKADGPWNITITINQGTIHGVPVVAAQRPVELPNVTLAISLGVGGLTTIQGNGGWPGTKAKWIMGSVLGGSKVPTLSLDLPELPLREVAKSIFPSPHLLADESFGNASLVLSLPAGTSEIAVTGQFALQNFHVEHERLAGQAIGPLTVRGDLDASYFADTHHIQLRKLLIARNLAHASFTGEVNLDRLAFDIAMKIPESSCQQLLGAVPEGLIPRLAQTRLEGRFSLDIHFALDEKTPDSTTLETQMNNQCRIVEFGLIPPPNYFRGPFAYVAYDQNEAELRLVSGQGTDRWAFLSQISPYVIEAILTAEDGKFWTHDGLTLPEIRRAIALNLTNHSFTHGASTITMQLAKNLFLTRERTLCRKIQELFFVWYLESYFEKAEILELYLNIVEFGPSIYGIQDASEYYLGRAPSELNAIESVYLIKLLPSPVQRHSSYLKGSLSAQQLAVLHRLLRIMLERGRLTPAEYTEALNTPLVFHLQGEPLPPPRLPVRRILSPMDQDLDQNALDEAIPIDEDHEIFE